MLKALNVQLAQLAMQVFHSPPTYFWQWEQTMTLPAAHYGSHSVALLRKPT
jgi:hypothetical protein